eukprot:347516-Pyramimonas_sp.AAC.1
MEDRWLFKLCLSPERHAPSSENPATVSKMKGGSFKQCGSCLSAAHTRLENCDRLKESHG